MITSWDWMWIHVGSFLTTVSLTGDSLPFSVARWLLGKQCSWKKVDREQFRHALHESKLCGDLPGSLSSEDMFNMYDNELRRLADRFAPETVLKITRRQRIAVWYDDESRQMRRSSRALERRYRRTGLEADRAAWIHNEKERHRINRIKESSYWLTCASTLLLRYRSCIVFISLVHFIARLWSLFSFNWKLLAEVTDGSRKEWH